MVASDTNNRISAKRKKSNPHLVSYLSEPLAARRVKLILLPFTPGQTAMKRLQTHKLIPANAILKLNCKCPHKTEANAFEYIQVCM